MQHVAAELRTEAGLCKEAPSVTRRSSDIRFCFKFCSVIPSHAHRPFPAFATRLLRVDFFPFMFLKKKGARKGYLFPAGILINVSSDISKWLQNDFYLPLFSLL